MLLLRIVIELNVQRLCFILYFGISRDKTQDTNRESPILTSPSRSGAFHTDVNKKVEKFTQSISFDKRLYEHDIRGSICHAKMLARQGLMTDAECQQIITTLQQIRQEIRDDQFQFRSELEDIHMNIEQSLIDRIGDVGRKLHTARSRNDQVSTDTRMWIREQIERIDQLLVSVQKEFVALAEREINTIIPAYTHLQRAQPVLAAHYCLAFCEKFERDRSRLADCRTRLNQCTLGTAALAGTSLPVDRVGVAQELDFDSVARNSLDAASDRDYVMEFVFGLSVIAIHLSNWAEDWIIWSTSEFNFVDLPQEYCTGSSIMPQKINPDVLELIRGKSARVLGSLQTLMLLFKGLPLTYNRDFQEDKPALFDAVDTVTECLDVAVGLIAGTSLKTDSIHANLDSGFLDATTMMEYLIKKGIPQRRAHHLIGELVADAMSQGKSLAELSVEKLKSLVPELDEEVQQVLGTSNAVNSFQSDGSTAPEQVAAEVERWREMLG